MPKNFRPTVHHIEKQDAIMVITLDERPDKVAFIFYDTTNFYELQRVKAKRY